MSSIIAAAAPGPNCSPCLHRVDESTSHVHTLIESTDFLIVLPPRRSNGAQAGEMDDNAVPHNSDGPASATCLFGACSASTHVSAYLFARSPKVTFTRVLQRIRYFLRRPDCFRPSDRLGFAPTENRRLHGILVC